MKAPSISKMELVQTGMLWILKSDLSTSQVNQIKLAYTYINKSDPDSVPFCTYVETSDKVGIPKGNLDKVQKLVGDFCIKDKSIAPRFDKPVKITKLKLRDYQKTGLKDSLGILKQYPSFNLSGEPGCVDKDTEYLTRQGWKNIHEYNGEDILVYHKDGTSTFERPSRFIKHPVQEWYDFNTYKGKTLMRLSEEHQVPYITSKGNLYTNSVASLYQNTPKISLVSNFKPQRLGVNYSPEILRVIVAVAADGSDSSSGLWRVNLKKSSKIQRLKELLLATDIKYRYHVSEYTGYTTFYIHKVFQEKGLCQLWEANLEQLQVIADEVTYWDGYIDRGGKVFYTTLKEEADFIQYVFSSVEDTVCSIFTSDRRGTEYNTGGKKYIRKSLEYEVRSTSHKHRNIQPKRGRGGCIDKVQAPEGTFKYCFTVSTGMFVARRDDFVFVTGNSGKSVLISALLSKLGVKTLIIAHLSMLTDQLKNEIEAFTDCKVTVLDAKNTQLGDINIATSQFISKNKDVWYQIKNKVGCIVVDEAESLGALTTLKIIQRAHARYHIFVSATFSRSVDNRTQALCDFAGSRYVQLVNDSLIKPTVLCVQCPEVFYPPISKLMYTKAKGNFFLKSSIDDKIIQVVRYSLSKDRQVLIATDIIKMQERLRDRLESLGISGAVINGSISADRRKSTLKDFDDGKVKVLLAFQVINAGISAPKISTIIRVSTPSSREKLEQLIGRARRDYEGKDGAFVVDLMFQGFNNTSRLALYTRKERQEGWKISKMSWSTFAKHIN